MLRFSGFHIQFGSGGAAGDCRPDHILDPVSHSIYTLALMNSIVLTMISRDLASSSSMSNA